MTTEGIGAVFLETHNWGKTARFMQALGFELELETDQTRANSVTVTDPTYSLPRSRRPSNRAHSWF